MGVPLPLPFERGIEGRACVGGRGSASLGGEGSAGSFPRLESELAGDWAERW